MKNALLIFVSVLLASCSSSDSGTPQNTDLKIDHITEGSATTTFNYSGDVLTSQVTTEPGQNTQHRDFTYAAGLLTDIHSYNTSGSSSAMLDESAIHYSYVSGRVIASLEDYGADGYYQSEYTYTGNTLTSRVEHNQDGDLTSSDTFEYFDNGNLKKENSSGFITNYTSYDDNKNYQALMYSDAMLKARRISKNNLLQDDRGRTYEYEYNSAGYPTKIIFKDGGVVVLTQFIYYQ